MKCIILAAGYATRMYPLTEHTPKSLLPVAGRPVIDYIMEQIETLDEVDVVYVVTNRRFVGQFGDWLAERSWSKRVELIDDGSTCNDDRLGAIGDLDLVIERTGLCDDVLVLAGDNLFEFPLAQFVAFFKEKGSAAVTIRRQPDPERLRRTGVVEVDDGWRVISFEEKPKNPRSQYAAPAFYIYSKEVLPLVRQYLDEDNNPDAPGNLVAWVHTRRPMYAFLFEEMRYDIGNIETYREVDRIYSERAKQRGQSDDA